MSFNQHVTVHLHVHSEYSPDGMGRIDGLIDRAKELKWILLRLQIMA